MSYLNAILDALQALRANVMRSVLTTLGIIIGVAAVIIMVSVRTGAETRVEALIQSLGSNLVIVIPGSSRGGGARMGSGTRPTLTEDDAAAIQKEIPSVQVAAASVRGTGQVVFGNLNWSTLIYGITPEYMEAREWAISSGHKISI